MSELLRLREWVSFADALRYMSLLGIEGTKKDFFLAYTSADMPLRLVCHDSPFYTLSPEPTGNGYPRVLCLLDETIDTYKTDGGTLYGAESPLVVAPGKRQRGYSEISTVWVNDPVSLDPERPQVEPIYVYWEFERDRRFLLLTWGDLLREQAEGALQFSRPHIEDLVNRALGKKSDAPAQASEPASYTTRLLQIQSEAIQKFWVNYDPTEPDTAPSKEAVISWLINEKKCPKNSAAAIDMIIRHDSRKSGGAKPKG